MYHDTHFDIVIKWSVCTDTKAGKTHKHKIKIGEYFVKGAILYGISPYLFVCLLRGTWVPQHTYGNKKTGRCWLSLYLLGRSHQFQL